MMKDKKLVLGISLIVISLLAYFVMAAAGDSVIIRSPISGTNYSATSSILFNVSYVNVTDITNPLNATFFLNISGTWMRVGNTSLTSGCTISSCFSTITNTTIPDGVYSVNATLANATGFSISIINLTNIGSMIYIDSTKPVVLDSSIISPTSGGNYSQNLVLNVSATDALVGIQAVLFNITNATSGLQNSTSQGSRESSTSSYSVTINTSHYVDGYYNITVLANDTVGNLNNSAIVYQVIFDNTLPTASFTCEDYNVIEDEEMDCDCTGTDTLSNISSISFDSTPSTSSVGDDQQANCTVTDRAGNIKISSVLYDVSEASSSTSGGSSGGSTSGTTGSTTGSSSSGNSTSTNSTTQNSSSGEANQLQANQENQNESNFNVNYWVLSIIIAGAAIAITIFVLIKKGILQRILKFNK